MNENKQWGMPDDNITEGGEAIKKRKRMPKTSGASRSLTIGVVCLLIALLVFIVLLTIMKRELYSVPMTSVIVAQEDVPEGILLDKTSIEKYFTVREEKTESLPVGYFLDAFGLLGKTTAVSIPKNQIANAAFFTDVAEIDEIEDAVELAIEVAKLGQAVAGTIRPGDHVDIQLIYAVDKYSYLGTDSLSDWDNSSTQYEYDENWDQEDSTTGEDSEALSDSAFSGDMSDTAFTQVDENASLDEFGNVISSVFGSLLTGFVDDKTVYSPDGEYAIETIAENVLVTNAYNTAGEDSAVAAVNGTNLVASIITVAVPKSMQPELQMAMERGTIRISRVIDSEERKKLEESAAEDAAAESQVMNEVVE